MKNLKYTLLFLILPMLALSQQMPHYSLYMLNDVVVNPSLISTKSENQIALMTQYNWTGFEGAPKTQSISYYNINHTKYGRGISIVNDNTGPISMISGTLSGSYLIPIDHKNKLSVGLSANILQYKINNSEIKLEDDGEIDYAMLSESDKVVGNSASIGVNYFSNKFNVGASIINVINSDLNLSNTGVENALVNHYYLHSSYNFSTSSGLDIIPSIMFKKIGASPLQMDINIRTLINNMIWGGVSYRTDDAVIAMIGINFSDYTLGYSYDVTTTKMNIPSYGSHGIVMTYNIKKREKDTDKDGVLDKDDDCPKTPGLVDLYGCPDRDKDGIKDRDDDCPDDYGLAKNDGCPDRDSDGVIDKDDRCPNTPGVPELQGCADSDGDGIQDEIDKCPYIKGCLRMIGCPCPPDTINIDFKDTIVQIDTTIIYQYDTIVTWKNIPLWADRVHFEFNKHNLDENSKLILNKIAEFLMRETDKDLQINGHADEIGTDKYNIKLSKKRAEEVKKYLIKQGVNKNRLSTQGLGESQKVSGSHEKNRRVEFIVIDFNKH